MIMGCVNTYSGTECVQGI